MRTIIISLEDIQNMHIYVVYIFFLLIVTYIIDKIRVACNLECK